MELAVHELPNPRRADVAEKVNNEINLELRYELAPFLQTFEAHIW